MNKLISILIALIFLNNCSFNEDSKIWKNKEKNFSQKENIKKIFADEKYDVVELNKGLKLNLSNIKTNNKIYDNKNNLSSQTYDGNLNKIGNYKFSKFDEVDNLNFEPIFLLDGVIFFDKKGTIIKYDSNNKVLWKKNYYSKPEKKLKPKLNFVLKDETIIVSDNIAKYYSINLENGELNWLKNNIYPFNSNIKTHKNKIFLVDYKNTLRCFNIEDGSECWNLQTEDSFTISNSKHSLVIIDELVVFNNSTCNVPMYLVSKLFTTIASKGPV